MRLDLSVPPPRPPSFLDVYASPMLDGLPDGSELAHGWSVDRAAVRIRLGTRRAGNLLTSSLAISDLELSMAESGRTFVDTVHERMRDLRERHLKALAGCWPFWFGYGGSC